MPDRPAMTRIDLQEVATRNRIARDIIVGFSSATPILADIWLYVETALDDTKTLSAEITRLSTELTRTRRDRANLVAAIHATIGAINEGEDDPLSYLHDELQAQGYGPNWGRA